MKVKIIKKESEMTIKQVRKFIGGDFVTLLLNNGAYLIVNTNHNKLDLIKNNFNETASFMYSQSVESGEKYHIYGKAILVCNYHNRIYKYNFRG